MFNSLIVMYFERLYSTILVDVQGRERFEFNVKGQ